MTVDYTVTLTVGDLSWTVHRGDVPLWPSVNVLDNLTVGWRTPNTPLWPTQPEPARAAFSLIAPDAADLAAITIGSLVNITVHLGATYPANWPDYGLDFIPKAGDPLASVKFLGRVAELTGRPMVVAGDDAWVLDLQCVDYVADLAQTEIAGEIPFQGINVRGMIEQRFLLAGVPFPGWSDGGEGSEQLTLNGGRVDAEPLLDAAVRFLSTYADGGDITGDEKVRTNHELYSVTGWRRGILRTLVNFDGERHPTVPYRIEWASRRHLSQDPTSATSYPAKLAETGSGWGVVLARAPEPEWADLTQIIDADYVDYAAVWTRTKNTEPTRVVVSNNTPPEYLPKWRQVAAMNRSRATGQVIARVTDCLAVDIEPARHVAEMYLPDNVEGARTDYAVESFRWYASRDPAWPLRPPWFPDTGGYPGHQYPIVVAGIPASQSPVTGGRGWYAGVLSGVDFTISGGEFTLDFSLRPGAPLPASDGGGLSPDDFTAPDVDPALAGLTVDDLNPVHSVDDFRLVRTLRVDHPLEIA